MENRYKFCVVFFVVVVIVELCFFIIPIGSYHGSVQRAYTFEPDRPEFEFNNLL